MRVATRSGACLKVNVHSRCRGCVFCGIDASPALKRIGTQTADQGIVAAAALQQFVCTCANQQVIKARADDVFDAQQRIARSIAAKTG